MRALSEEVLITNELHETGDNETLTTAVLDMSGYEGVTFAVAVAQGEAATVTVHAEQGEESDGSDMADLAGTSVDCSPEAAADGEAILDIVRPQERYVRLAVVVPDVTTPPVVSVKAMRYGAREHPVTQSIANAEAHVSPAEGTA